MKGVVEIQGWGLAANFRVEGGWASRYWIPGREYGDLNLRRSCWDFEILPWTLNQGLETNGWLRASGLRD